MFALLAETPGQCLLPRLRVSDQPARDLRAKYDRMAYKKMKFAVVVISIAMLCACGVMPPSEKKVLSSHADKWVGRTIDELIVANGEPTNVYPLGSGGRIFEYSKLETGQTQTRKHIKNYAHKSRGVTTSDSGPSCTIRFNISASDIIESWMTEGEGCN